MFVSPPKDLQNYDFTALTAPNIMFIISIGFLVLFFISAGLCSFIKKTWWNYVMKFFYFGALLSIFSSLITVGFTLINPKGFWKSSLTIFTLILSIGCVISCILGVLRFIHVSEYKLHKKDWVYFSLSIALLILGIIIPLIFLRLVKI